MSHLQRMAIDFAYLFIFTSLLLSFANSVTTLFNCSYNAHTAEIISKALTRNSAYKKYWNKNTLDGSLLKAGITFSSQKNSLNLLA